MLTLDPTAPLLWRSPTSLQLGVAPVLAVLPEMGTLEESVLVALRSGASRTELAQLGPPQAVDALLDRLRPALMAVRDDRPAPARPVPPPPAPVQLDGPHDLVAWLGGALRQLGHPDRHRGGAGVVVLAAHHVLSPHRVAPWIADDVPHLPVILLDQAAVVGPLVVPGRTPCLRCVDEHRMDADPAWAAVGPQLLHRRPAALAGDPRLRAEVAALLGRALAGDPSTGSLAGVAVRIDGRTGAVSRFAPAWHGRCLCRSLAQPAAGRPGTGSVAARPARDRGGADPSPRTRAAAAAAPA